MADFADGARGEFWTFARAMPDHPAVVEADGTVVSAGALLAEANRLVHLLRARGLVPGDVVVVDLGPSAEFLALYFAALQAGWFFAPISPKLVGAEIGQLLGVIRPKLFVFEPETAEAARLGLAVSPVDAWMVSGFPAAAAAESDATPADRIAGAAMFFTAGTTGRPRAIVRRLAPRPPEAAVTAAQHLGWVAGIAPRSGAVHLVTSPLHHSASLVWCTDNLHLGHTVVLMGKWAPEQMLALIERHGVTGTFMVPTHFHRLLALPAEVRAKYDLSSLRHVVHGGAPCPVAVKRAMLAWWGPVIYEVYGAAEGGAAKIGPAEWLAHPGSVGRGGSFKILREDGTPCAAGEVGTLHFRPAQPYSYHDGLDGPRRELSSVGDLGFLDEAGYLFLVGRREELIISGGVNIYPAEIEAALLDHPKVGDVAVLGAPSAEWGEEVRAVVEARPGISGSDELRAELLAFCRARLASFKVPRRIDFVPELPRDANGKLRKRELREGRS